MNFLSKVRRRSGEAAALQSSVRASNPSFFEGSLKTAKHTNIGGEDVHSVYRGNGYGPKYKAIDRK